MELSLAMPLSNISNYLKNKKWLNPNETVTSIEKPGEGNMNMVIRVITDHSSLILKQANAFVQKYPSIPAPIERIAVEQKFYELVKSNVVLSTYLPKLIGYDPENHILAIQDLGIGIDFSFLYQKTHSFQRGNLFEAIQFLSNLHCTVFSNEIKEQFPKNLKLRQLNYEHLFVFPYLEENGLDLDTIQEGLQEIALPYQQDESLKKQMEKLGQVYLSRGDYLLHGDFYPGSWLQLQGSLKVIDPEFCFFGPVEYDLGVLIAHMKMAQCPQSQLNFVLEHYNRPSSFDEVLLEKFVGMELMRRIIGLAQLPLDLTLEEKASLLKEAHIAFQ